MAEIPQTRVKGPFWLSGLIQIKSKGGIEAILLKICSNKLLLLSVELIVLLKLPALADNLLQTPPTSFSLA